METALGMSYAGKRALVCMKHVGMNVAADCFMNAAITGANGGMVVTAADDPSMHSSQNEQDSRAYGKFALVPIMEPSNQQEAYDMTRHAFDLSERLGTPVLMRITTRLAHSRSGVETREGRKENDINLPEDKRQFVLLPAIAKKRYQILLDKQPVFEEESDNSPFNQYLEGEDKSMGIIACGIGYNYLMEAFHGQCPYPIVKVSQYPLPRRMITRLSESCKRIVVIDVTGEDPIVLINPRIMETSGEQTGGEGCLSVPGKSGIVTRPNYVKVKAYDRDMNPIELEGTELLARAFCHEIDHLDGHLYVEKVEGELSDVEEEA